MLAACALLANAALVAPQAAAQQTTCENRVSPPPAVDTSEDVPDGARPPEPLEVPDPPIGGDRMGECGPVLPEGAPRAPSGITAKTWLVADMDSGAVLAAYDPHGRQRPASVIKVLLAMVAAKELPLDSQMTAIEEDTEQECTCIGLKAGNTYTVEQLLQSLVMASGNDVANALARRLGGLPSAIRKMNALATELGARDTRAITPSGLDAPGTSTSAYDVALIFRAAMKYPDFARAIATQRIEFPAEEGGTKPVINDNRLMTSYAGALGGKTGFTDDAQHTYVGAAERDGRRLVAVLLRAQQQPLRTTDQAARLLDYGFSLPASTTVGKLVDGAPQAKRKATGANPTLTEPAPGQAVDEVGAPEPTSTMGRAFGNVGGPLTALAGLGVLGGLVMYLRAKRARAARAKRAAAASGTAGVTSGAAGTGSAGAGSPGTGPAGAPPAGVTGPPPPGEFPVGRPAPGHGPAGQAPTGQSGQPGQPPSRASREIPAGQVPTGPSAPTQWVSTQGPQTAKIQTGTPPVAEPGTPAPPADQGTKAIQQEPPAQPRTPGSEAVTREVRLSPPSDATRELTQSHPVQPKPEPATREVRQHPQPTEPQPPATQPPAAQPPAQPTQAQPPVAPPGGRTMPVRREGAVQVPGWPAEQFEPEEAPERKAPAPEPDPKPDWPKQD
ncbi:Serine-type D-Ala-D-Ala carboxypeptidase [Actinosynnema mirum DSM 43827]|uniref:Serine-type D-Ala-D-Ala carboxypeptidase n=1 Tax=Actinosynnema mirum (strain ATCC 29888 / DSM 43827 / JCM 3225 / NBRC 14064 / NCIMB 13271 / NRRL B-12336 / IMRU 3971 / 101) TaxID=446462 RepID=C6WKL6_ACTMD|nr:Serine-type D-Ala-D-Ala carboxypeptidase [Actinosynnema mirum DSM 43827]